MQGAHLALAQAIPRDPWASLLRTFSGGKMSQGCDGATLSLGLQCLGPDTQVLRSGLGPCWGALLGFGPNAKEGLAWAVFRGPLLT